MTDETTPPIDLASGFPPATDAAWRALVEKALKGADFHKRLVSRTADGIAIRPLYTPASEKAEAPGVAPFTRGSTARLGSIGWRIAQLRPETDVESLLAAIRADVEGGADAITIRLAAPGRSGMPADIATIEHVLSSLPEGPYRIAFDLGAQHPAAVAAIAALAAKPAFAERIASLGLDPLSGLASTGTATFLKPGANAFTAPVPLLAAPATTLLADARPYHEAGASEAQEIAALLGTLVAYLRAAEAQGIAPARTLQSTALAMATDADLFLGLAKLRAARRLVHRVADACGAGDAAGTMPLTVTTSARMMARRDPWVNMLRTTAAATAAALGGADEIVVLPYTWALGAPDTQPNRIARNVGLVLREEAGLGRIVDAAGGSWALESLTDELAAKAWAIFQSWESAGGMIAALASGRVQADIAAVAAARAKDIATRRIELTGVSAFPMPGDDGVATAPWPTPPRVAGSPAIAPLRPMRLAAPFEGLRDAADKAGKRLKVLLATLGTPGEHGPRAMWIANLLAAGGIETATSGDILASQEAGAAFAQSGAVAAIVCGADQTYAELAEATAMALKGAGASHVWLAGRPGESQAALEAAGIDGFLHAGQDAVATLGALHRALGIP